MRRLATTVLALLLLVPGCITFYGEGEVRARVLVTREVGTQVLVDENLTLPEGSTAMDALHAVAEVETRHGGGFVHAVDGLASQYPERKVDWFYHVDTELAGVGAAQHTLADRELVLFDHRSWERTMHLDHVLTGLEDWPIDRQDPTFAAAEYQRLQGDEHARAKLFAQVDGSQLRLLDARGEPAQTLEAPWLLAHAVDGPDQEPRILLVPSGEEARGLVDTLADVQPTGVGAAVTPNASMEVPAG